MPIPELSTMQTFDKTQVTVLRRILQRLHRLSVNATGDTITGDLTIEGDLTVTGSSPGGWQDDGTVVRLTTASDSVGIGTASPAYKLEVIGDIRASGTITAGSSITIDGNAGKITSTTGTVDFENENLVTTGNIGGDQAGFTGYINMDGIAAPAVSPSGEGRIYFDSTSNDFQVSENGAAYVPLFGGASAQDKQFAFMMGT